MKKVLLAIVLCLCLVLSSCNFGQVEDTNGDDDYSLCSFEEKDILTYGSFISAQSISSRDGNSFSFKCKMLSGLKKLETINLKYPVTITIDCKITKGNAYIAFISDGAILEPIPLNEISEFTFDKSASDLEIRIIGESCEVDIKGEITYNK